MKNYPFFLLLSVLSLLQISNLQAQTFPTEYKLSIHGKERILSEPHANGKTTINFSMYMGHLLSYFYIEGENLETYHIWYSDVKKEGKPYPEVYYASIPIANMDKHAFDDTGDIFAEGPKIRTKENFVMEIYDIDGTLYESKELNTYNLATWGWRDEEKVRQLVNSSGIAMSSRSSEELLAEIHAAEANKSPLEKMFSSSSCPSLQNLSGDFIWMETANYFWGSGIENGDRIYYYDDEAKLGAKTLYKREGTTFYDAEGEAKFTVKGQSIYRGDNTEGEVAFYVGDYYLYEGDSSSEVKLVRYDKPACLAIIMSYLFYNNL